jgi:hypothetical protein
VDAGPPRPADHAQGSQIESVEAAGEPFCDVTRTHQQNPLADQRLGGPAQPQLSILVSHEGRQLAQQSEQSGHHPLSGQRAVRASTVRQRHPRGKTVHPPLRTR